MQDLREDEVAGGCAVTRMSLPVKLALAAILLAALGLRLWKVTAESMWLDEGATILLVRTPMKGLLRKIIDIEQTPPAYQLVLHGWVAVFGDSELSLRMPSVLMGVGAVWVLFLLGRLLFDVGTGLVAAGLLAVSIYHISYSQEARANGMMFFLAVTTTYLFVRMLRERQAWLRAVYVALAAIMLYTHLFGVFTVLLHNVMYLLLWWRGGTPGMKFRQWITLQAGVAVLFGPWVNIVLFNWLKVVTNGWFWIQEQHSQDILNALLRYAGGGQNPQAGAINLWAVRLLAALLAGLAVLAIVRNWRRMGVWLAVLWVVCCVMVPVAMAIFTSPFFAPRYGIAAMAGIILLAAAGARALPWEWRGGTLAVLLACALLAFPVGRIHKAQVREAMAVVSREAEPGDLVFVSTAYAMPLIKYYTERQDLRFDGSDFPGGLLGASDRPRHLWLILTDTAFSAAEVPPDKYRILQLLQFRDVDAIELQRVDDTARNE